MDITFSKILEAIITGCISSVAFAGIVWVIQSFRYDTKLKAIFHGKKFNTYYKRFPNEIVQTVECFVDGNVISFKGKRIKDDDLFEGEFIMNELNLKIGEGYYSHKEHDGYGFGKVIIKDNNTFLVEFPYINMKENEHKNKFGLIEPQAFIWRRIHV